MIKPFEFFVVMATVKLPFWFAIILAISNVIYVPPEIVVALLTVYFSTVPETDNEPEPIPLFSIN